MNQDERQQLIDAGISFMQTVTGIYGPEKGQELWITIADTVDKDLKNEIFMAILTGNYMTDRIRVTMGSSVIWNKVGVIKCFRQYDRRKLGLKEAKDLADAIEQPGATVTLEVDPMLRAKFRQELQQLGLFV